MTLAHLGLGSNLGDRLAHLQGAVDGLAATVGTAVVAVSSVYETEPVGGPVQDDFLNAVVAVETDLDAFELLAVCQRLEEQASRVRAERWGPRTLDVDILLFGDACIQTDQLVVPHPRIAARAFVTVPLVEIAPALLAEFPGEVAASGAVRRFGASLTVPS